MQSSPVSLAKIGPCRARAVPAQCWQEGQGRVTETQLSVHEWRKLDVRFSFLYAINKVWTIMSESKADVKVSTLSTSSYFLFEIVQLINHFWLTVIKLKAGNEVVVNLVQVTYLKRSSKIESRNGAGELIRGKQQRCGIACTLQGSKENRNCEF